MLPVTGIDWRVCFQGKRVMESMVRSARLLSMAARSGDIEMWKVVVDAVVAAGQSLLKEVHWHDGMMAMREFHCVAVLTCISD